MTIMQYIDYIKQIIAAEGIDAAEKINNEMRHAGTITIPHWMKGCQLIRNAKRKI